MKVFRKISFLVILFLAMFVTNAQEFYNPLSQINANANSLNYKLTGRRYIFRSTLKGSSYLNDDWQRGSVILENGDRYDSLYLRLNTVNEDLIWYNERTGAQIVLDSYIIDEFVLGTGKNTPPLFRKMIYNKYPKGEHYYNVLYDGKMKFLLWYETDETGTSEYRDMLGYLRNTEYKLHTQFFVVLPDENMVKIAGNRKSFINLFPEQKKRVRQLLRKNKIDLIRKNKAEMARLVKLIDAEFFPE